MSLDALIAALALPESARVDRKVPKKALLEHGATTAEDRRAIQEGIEELLWVAALKPENIGVPVFKDELREYLEVAVLVGTLRSSGKAGTIARLVHRAIPYPVVLGLVHEGALSLSVAHKRRSQGQAAAVVVEEILQTRPFQIGAAGEVEAGFLGSLALAEAPQGDMFRLYQGWHDRLAAFDAAAITGSFRLVSSEEDAAARWEGLAAHARLTRELASLRAQAERETQMSRRVDLNLAIKQVLADLAAVEKVL